jgi:ubiquinone biosynthesis protein COQ4
LREGRALGKAAAKIAHEDIEALMHEDIDLARKRLNIGKPVIYRDCIAQLLDEGLADDDMRLPELAAA